MPTSRTKDSPGDASPPPAALQHLHLFITPEPVPLDLQSVLTEPLFDATIRAGARDRPDAINKTIHALRNAAIVWKADSTEWSELVAVLNCIGFPMATSPRASPSPPLTSADLTAAESHPEAHTVALQEIAAYAHRSTRRLSELLFAMLYVRGRVLTNAYRTKSMTQQADAAQIVSLKAEVERLRRKVLERGSKSDDDRRRRVVAEGYLKDMQDLTINEIALRKSARPTDLTRPRIHPTLPRPVSESFLRREFVKDVGTGSTSFEIQRTPSVTEAFAESTSPRGGDGAGAGRLPVRRSIFRKSSEEARPRQGSEPEPSVLDDLHFRGLAAKMELGRLKAVENSAGGLSEVTLSPSSTGSDTNTHSSSGGSDVVTNKSAGSSGCSTSGSAKQPAEKSGRFSFSFLSGRTSIDSRPTTERILAHSQSRDTLASAGKGSLKTRFSRVLSLGLSGKDRRKSSATLTATPPPSVNEKRSNRSLDARSRPVIVDPASIPPLPVKKTSTQQLPANALRPPVAPQKRAFAAPLAARSSRSAEPNQKRLSAAGSDRAMADGSLPMPNSVPDAPRKASPTPRGSKASNPELRDLHDDLPLQILRDKHLKDVRRRTFHGTRTSTTGHFEQHPQLAQASSSRHLARQQPSFVRNVDYTRRHSWGPQAGRHTSPPYSQHQQYPYPVATFPPSTNSITPTPLLAFAEGDAASHNNHTFQYSQRR